MKCAICNTPYLGYGHNGQPVSPGRVCSMCNDLHVIPARLASFMTPEAKPTIGAADTKGEAS